MESIICCLPPVPFRTLEVANRLWSSLVDSDVLWKVRGWAGIKDNQLASCCYTAELSRPLPIAPSANSFPTLSSLPHTPTPNIIPFDTDIASALCPQSQAPKLWITYHQASRTNKQGAPQLLDVSEAAHIFDLEDVLDHVLDQGFVDSKWRSVTWWEDCTSVRLKSSNTLQDLLARGAGSTPETALHLIIADVPMALWVHYEYLDDGHPHTATQRIRLDLPHFKCERLAHLTNHIFAKGYLPCKARSLVSWRGACGKHIEEGVKVEDVLSLGEGVCESKPLRLVIDL